MLRHLRVRSLSFSTPRVRKPEWYNSTPWYSQRFGPLKLLNTPFSTMVAKMASGSSVRLLGDPILKKKAEPVANVLDPVVQFEMQLLGQELDAFRKKHGYGRAMSAPQVGHSRRIIACNMGKGTFFIINPEITHKSHETFTMWDDCMSFPWLMVKVHRHRTISIKYQTEEGESLEWKHMDQATSELLQHEIDHLDGLLSIDRAVGTPSEAIISREVYELNKAYFNSQVDYVIHPTIAQ